MRPRQHCCATRRRRAKPIYPLSWTGRVAIPVCECASLNFDARSPPSRLQVARKSPRPACCSSWWAVSGYFTITSRSQPSQAYLYLVRRPQVVLRSCSVPMPPLHGREHPTLSRRRKLGLVPFPAHLPHRCHPVGFLDSRPLRGPSSWLSPRRCLARDPAQACAWLLHLEPRHHPLLW